MGVNTQMKYLKKFDEGYVNHSSSAILKDRNLMVEQKPWDDLWTYLTEVFKILGFDFRTQSETDTNGVDYTVFKFTVDFNIIPYSILSIMSQHLITKEISSSVPQILPIFKNSIPSEVSTISIIVSDVTKKIKSNKFRINPKSPEEAYKLLSNKIISAFSSFDNMVKVIAKGISSNREPLTVSDLIVSYISSNSFGSPITIPIETLKRINWIIENDPNGMVLFNNIRTHNPFLFDKLKQVSNKTDVAADMGDLGFE